MKNTIFLFLLILFLSACSIEVSEEPATDTPVSGSPAEAAQPVDAADPSPVEDNAVSEDPPWSDLGLSGQLYFVGFISQKQTLIKLELETGEETIIFDPPDGAWLSEIAVSPDSSQIVMAYSPPPAGGQVQFGFTGLYLIPADGSAEPVPLLERADDSETYFNLSWPSERHIYYAHFTPSADDLGALVYARQVERLSYSEGERPNGELGEVLAENAAWPRVSADGTLLAYVTEANEFILAGADGSNPRTILDPDAFQAIDAPLFAPDNSAIIFSAVETEPTAALSIWDRLLGVLPNWGLGVAEAHAVPSDWWRITLDGGESERLTNLNAIGLYGDFSPDGRHIAFISADGVNVMNPDGSGVFQLIKIPTVGTINWVPG
jgi:Tol biopolymer transport system component